MADYTDEIRGAMSEPEFQQWFRSLPWFKEFKDQYGEEPNPDDPDYDYRAAHKAGIEPQRYAPDNNRYHWPSKTQQGGALKSKDHPTAWAEEFMQQTDVDPFTIGVRDPVSAESYRKRGR